MAEKKLGRKPVELDENQVRELAAMHCTIEEIAAVMGCSYETIYRRFSNTIKEARRTGNVSLRRLQYKSAEQGKWEAQKWLGQQWLGQSDKNLEIQATVQPSMIIKLLDGSEIKLGVEEIQHKIESEKENGEIPRTIEAKALPDSGSGE